MRGPKKPCAKISKISKIFKTFTDDKGRFYSLSTSSPSLKAEPPPFDSTITPDRDNHMRESRILTFPSHGKVLNTSSVQCGRVK